MPVTELIKQLELKKSSDGVYVCLDKTCAIIGYTNPKMLESLIQDLSIEYGASNIAVVVPDLYVCGAYARLLNKYSVKTVVNSPHFTQGQTSFDLGTGWVIVYKNGIWVIERGAEIFAAIADDVTIEYRGRRPSYLVLYYLERFGCPPLKKENVDAILGYVHRVGPGNPAMVFYPEEAVGYSIFFLQLKNKAR